MSATTPVYLLPYPSPSDPADVPADLQRLANQIEVALVPGTANGQVPIWDNAAKTWKPGTNGGAEIAFASNSGRDGLTTAAQVVITLPSATYPAAPIILDCSWPWQYNSAASQNITGFFNDDTAGVALGRVMVWTAA